MTVLDRYGRARDRALGLAENPSVEFQAALLDAVSHDLRTPLASIKACISGLLQTDVDWTDDARREFLVTVDEEVDRLDRIIGCMLDVSRLDSGTLRPYSRTVWLEDIVAETLTSLGPRAATVDVIAGEALPAVVTDGALIERALANLVANALEWSPHGGRVRLEVGASGASAELRVVDHGPGIPAMARERVFQRFDRLGDVTHRVGVGLGLSIARGFVEAVGGSLSLQETPGGGLTAVIALPF